MRKRIIALLLALILTVGLLPTVALAADAQPDVQVSKSDDNLNLVKTIKKAGENYTVTLESWATGAVTTETTPMPLDIILVLDESGSMSETFSSKQGTYYEKIKYYRTNQNYYKWSKENDGIWYKDIDNNYYKVTVQREKVEDFISWHYKFTYTYSKNGTAMTIGSSERKNTNPGYTFYRQYTGDVNITKRAALVEAATNFADSVYKEATKANGPDHRIAVVTYSGDAQIKTGTTVNDALISVTTGLNAIKSAINDLETEGGTYINKGIQKANNIFEKNPIAEEGKRARVMIVFTDGAPGRNGMWCKDSQYYDTHKIAQAAIKEANTAEQTYKATVYTIGIFQGANVGNPKSLPTYTTDVKVSSYDGEYRDDNEKAKATANSNRFMHLVSSNYPNAINMTNTGNYNVKLEEDDNNTYYLAAASASELSDVFTAISSSIKTDTTELNETATIIDNIPGNFTIPAEAREIKVYTAKCTGKTGETLSWEERQASNLQPTTTTNTTTGVKSVSVTGFDYSDEWCGLDENSAPHGSKLIIEFTIKHDNYGGTQPTNAGASIKDKEGNEVIKVDDPAIPVKITEPSITGVTRSKVYDGTGFDVLSTIAEDINALADGKKNAYVDIVVTVTSGSNTYTYTIKKGDKSGSWDKTGLTTDKDVKIESGAVSSYTYDLSITFKDATANGAADAIEKTTATYTITKRPVTLTSGSDEKKYDGTPLTKHEVTASTGEGVGFVGGDGATYTFTGSQTEPGESDNEFEYTLIGETKATNYEITKQLGKLKVTKDDTEITVTITGKQETKEYNGQTQTVTGFDYTVTGAEKNDVAVTLNQSGKDSASGKDVTTANEGKYMMGLTASDFNVSSTKYSNVTITTVNDGWLKITPIAITLKSGDASKTYDGTALTNTTVNETGAFATGEGLTYNVTGSQIEVGSSKNAYTYTAKNGTTLTNYAITKQEGDLTVTLPDLTALPKVTVDCTNSDVSHADMTGVTLTEAAQYSLGNSQKVENAAAYTRTVTLTEAGKGYCVSKYNETYGSHALAATDNVTEITMTYSEENGVWTWRATPTNFLLKVKCTTPTVEVDLGNYVKKTLAGTNFHENFEATFTVEVTYTDDNDNGTATGSVRFTGADTKDFGFASTVELKKNHVYKFTATERADNVPGVVYDTKMYSFALKITAEGDVVFGSVVEGVFVANETEQKYVTITNTYTEPTYAVEKSVINDDASDNIPDSLDRDIYQYPTNGKFIVEKTYTDDTITFLYVIEVSGKNGAEMTIQEKDGGKFISVDYSTETRATINPNAAQDTYTVKLTADVDASDPIKLYAEKTFHKDADGKFPTTATNALLVNGKDGPKDNTTIEERGTLTVDFGALVHKHLTVTGDKSFNGATFTVNFTEGLYAPLAVNNSIEVYADAGVGKEKLPDLTASVTYTADERNRGLKDFDGADLTINTEGNYSYIVSEQIPAGATGYDTKKYVVGIVVVPDGDGLKVEHVWYHELVEDLATHPEIIPGGPTFHNTIDTGKDDYYPIIIPTIINKDTGMLNKTDHFAYVIGYPDGTVHPNGQITRAEVATIFFRLLRDEVRDGAFTTSNTYSDVAYGKWYNNPISTMSALGIITGYPDGTFKPNKPITRAEFAAIAARFDETQSGKSATFSDVIGHWAAKEIGIAYYNDWIKGYPDGTFKPDQNITRAEAMTLINRVLERKPESPADLLTNMNTWTDNLDTSKWYYLDVQEATNSHGYTRKTFNYELWRQMLPDPDWSRYER